MSDISKLTIEGIEYDIKDETARADIEDIRTELMGTSAMADEVLDVLDGISSEDKIEAIIDNSGVLDSTDGTATEKVEQLIKKADLENYYYALTERYTSAQDWFGGYGGKKLPRSNFIKATNTVGFAQNSKIEEVDYYLNWGANTTSSINASRAFQGTTNLKHMVGVRTEKCYNLANFFYNSAIEEIDEPFNFSSITQSGSLNNAFSCSNLREIRFVAETIKWSIAFSSAVLSTESKQSIFDGLAYVETAQTLTLHAEAKILQSQVDSANAKGWTVAGGTVVSEEEYYG